MSSPRPPNKPTGPPPRPGMSPNGRPAPRGMVGVSNLNGSPGRPPAGRPPPGNAPRSLKAPPAAPPPRGLMQSIQRPSVNSIKGIDIPGGNGPPPRGLPRGAPGRPPRGGAPPPRASPGRPMGSPNTMTDYDPTKDSGPVVVGGSLKRPVGAPRFGPMGGRPPRAGSLKQGAITRFEEPPPEQEPAEKKAKTDSSKGTKEEISSSGDPTVPMGKAPRPLAPEERPAGLPTEVNLPPKDLDKDMKKVAGPSAPPPDRGRGPPKAEPVEKKPIEEAPAPEPPTTEPPYKRGLKEKVEEVEFVPRYEREDPEFESSDDEEENEWREKKRKEKERQEALIEGKIVEQELEPKEPSVVPETEVLGSGVMSVAETLESSVGAPEESLALPPVAEGSDYMVSAYAPPPPSELVPDQTESPLADDLKSGRLSIRCIRGIDIKRKSDPNKIPRLDPYIRMKLGAAEKFPYQNTKVKRKQDNFPDFENEIISFDVMDPSLFVFGEDIIVTIEIWNKSTFKDEMLGAVTMSAVRFFKRPFTAYKEEIPVYLPGQKTTTQKLELEFVYEEARAGMFVFTLFEARGLRKVDAMAKQDPYIQMSLGQNYKKRSKTIKDNPTDPYFGEETIMMWSDGKNWVDDLMIEVLDEELGPDKAIAFTHFCLLPYMNMKPDSAVEDTYDLFYTVLMDPRDDRSKKEIAYGELVMKVQYLPAGALGVKCIAGTNLAFPETAAIAAGDEKRIDPYVKFTLSGQAVDMVKQSPVDKDGGSDPHWDYSINFDLVDQYLLDVEVFHQSPKGSQFDILLGFCQISLLNIFRSGSVTSWQTLKQRKANGGLKELGNINLELTFVGQPNVSYPLNRSGIDSFDDSIRKRPEPEKEIDEEQEIKKEISTVPVIKDKKRSAIDEIKEEEEQLEMDTTQEFTDAEIKEAFAFIDLDHNNFVGAAEIRHILVCMGEMITDDEINMMIKMVDLDGDGQVSFTEFRTLVLHPDPGGADMHKAVVAANDVLAEKERQALTGKAGGMDLSAFQRQKEMILRESKKKAFHSYVVDNETDFDSIRTSYYFYLELPKTKRVGGRVDFDIFCQTLRIEPITEYKMLFNLFDSEEMGDVDLREVLCTMLNFVEVGREERLKFQFEMYDEAKSGFISRKEVEEVLRGNHMLSSVTRKADTIMKQATTTDTGTITLPEFIVVSKKFPNILLPGNIAGNGNGTGSSSGASRRGSRSGSSKSSSPKSN